MKRKLLLIIAALFLAFGLTACANNGKDTGEPQDIPIKLPQESETISETPSQDDAGMEANPLDTAITAAILEQNQGKYLPGECYGVGYKIIERLAEENILSVYALTEYVEYRFEDDVFVNVSGSNPKVLMRFQRREDDSYDLIYYTRLDVLSGLSDEEMEGLLQPLMETGKEYTYTEKDIQEVRKQADQYASRYLESIGRAAEIGIRQNHAGQLLEELVSAGELLDKLFKDEEIGLYPNWTGTTERLENGERYVYRTMFDEEAQKIVYTKMQYNTKEIVKEITVDVANGTILRG